MGPRAGEHEDPTGPRAGEDEDPTGSKAGEHEGRMGPRAGGFYPSLDLLPHGPRAGERSELAATVGQGPSGPPSGVPAPRGAQLARPLLPIRSQSSSRAARARQGSGPARRYMCACVHVHARRTCACASVRRMYRRLRLSQLLHKCGHVHVQSVHVHATRTWASSFTSSLTHVS